MPRARVTTTSEVHEQPVVKRAPRRRAAAVTDAAPALVTETASPIPSQDQNDDTTKRVPLRRKAPRVVNEPVTVAQSSKRRRPYLPFVIVAVVFAISVGVSAAVGLSDSGSIDVAARMNEQSALQAGNDGGDGAESGQRVIPVQNSQPPSVPNGGLVGMAPAEQVAYTPPPLPPEVTASSTATSTKEIVASSTEAIESGQTASTTL